MTNPSGSEKPRVSALARRIHGWSWQAFPIGMGTGAVYVTLSQIKEHSQALTKVETFFYFLNIAFFLLNVTTLIAQTILFPRQSWRLINDPSKSVFVPVIVLSYGTIIIGTINYAYPHHVGRNLIYVLFWIYVALACLTCFPMLVIWFNKTHDLKDFTPAYVFLILPLMVVGVIAYNVLKTLDATDKRAVGILIVSYFFQGFGFFITFFYLCIYIIRIMTTGFLEGAQASGAFVACAPPGFTALALLNLGEHAKDILHAHNLISPNAGEIWFAMSVFAALMLWGLAVFLFVLGILPYWFKVEKDLKDILGCWALAFPNIGWISTTRVLGDVFDIVGFYDLHLVLSILMCALWLVLSVLTVLAFWKGLIFRSKEKDVLRDIQYYRQKNLLKLTLPTLNLPSPYDNHDNEDVQAYRTPHSSLA